MATIDEIPGEGRLSETIAATWKMLAQQWFARAEKAEAAAAVWKVAAKRYRLRLKLCNELAQHKQENTDKADIDSLVKDVLQAAQTIAAIYERYCSENGDEPGPDDFDYPLFAAVRAWLENLTER